jgi:hypothetical protein
MLDDVTAQVSQCSGVCIARFWMVAFRCMRPSLCTRLTCMPVCKASVACGARGLRCRRRHRAICQGGDRHHCTNGVFPQTKVTALEGTLESLKKRLAELPELLLDSSESEGDASALHGAEPMGVDDEEDEEVGARRRSAAADRDLFLALRRSVEDAQEELQSARQWLVRSLAVETYHHYLVLC